MNWPFILEEIPTFAQALVVTLNVSVWGIVLSLIIGVFAAAIESAHVPVVRQIIRVYIELSRNTPLLVQLYFIYFGLPKLGVRWSPTQSAIVGLAFLGGSYMAEALRGGLDAVAPIQRESARMLGMNGVQIFSRVILPQALSTAMPGVIANVIFLIKESSVVSAIALADIMYEAKDIMGNDYNTYEALVLLTVSYLIVLLPISLIGTWLERRFDYARN
ncbi:amino acid ABC transporter permease [Alloscardovia omnicolens]|uniref:amino acid ABC transporter permease n=1 Tax=Alloscardovia omnicolens TaxID=419015 RepID=UPI00254EFC47|nr:amino acid ABC transporter permease [Alloscardovia omnicolens]MDK6664320.1 amino acid ABC transporter permease [Alloscardovia omnicolens]MDK7748678.1 amino acid ABC transporter permease [Alloscardovia omnicolens]